MNGNFPARIIEMKTFLYEKKINRALMGLYIFNNLLQGGGGY